MDISKQKILEIIHKNLSLEDIEHSFIYWDKKLLQQGIAIPKNIKATIALTRSESWMKSYRSNCSNRIERKC